MKTRKWASIRLISGKIRGMPSISVVINTKNEEKNLPRALASVKGLADEIVVVDMHSTDDTRDIAKKAGARVYLHRETGYVEPARNFALRKAQGDWILILDADEEVRTELRNTLRSLAKDPKADFYRLPRKNIIFGKWIEHSRWWPDYNIRFFKKGKVSWSEIIHSVPETQGKGLDLPTEEENAIVHYNYTSISQFIERLNRYSDIQSKFLEKGGYVFDWRDLIKKPVAEFVSRFLAGEGYKDGVHGLALGILQAFSEFVVYLKVWEHTKFKDEKLHEGEIGSEMENAEKEINHWLVQSGIKKQSTLGRILRKLSK